MFPMVPCSSVTSLPSPRPQITGHQWRWFDLGSGKWCGYPSANNKAIDDAYWAGEPQVQILTGRRKYNIIFNSMVQVSDGRGVGCEVFEVIRA